ncbi:Fur family transcriptional regulator, ferric uptake regulator [Allochromatium warmingii]|uniref:Ferric uptake regulation protein n=1 Tax=Allochromatium warmingii TaxID=61595 RepID=A0A1H3HH32_ALLWA|nr:ferric iron uptake transcriptional regulator [Allochromatium warmingii]SDY14772.1 Fur family transcriptional regulator, ferric uptake regulator [Allochromatium warmingii]
MENKQIKQAGLKVTAPRVKILDILEHCGKRHMSAEDVYRELLRQDEDIGLATVYRVLTQFEGAGIVCRRHFESGQAVFELNRGEHHDHLVCVQCGLITEFVDPMIETRQERIAAEHHFKIEDHSLVVYGICQTCQRKKS